MQQQDYLITLEGITKEFPGVKALSNVQFNLKSGEVHAVLGENGAGKSTLMKIIGGIYKPDEGSYKLGNQEIFNLTPKKAEAQGIAIIHQELNLCEHLSVAENIFLGREETHWGVLAKHEMNRQAEKILSQLKIDINPKTLISQLPVSKQQMVEIAKALAINARIMIMDEPTSALTEKEIEELFRIIKNLRSQGCGIVYISHRLEELDFIADRVSIYRDGEYIITKNYQDTHLDEIISYMVGREITEKFPRIPAKVGQPILEVKDFSAGMVQDINFTLNSGEIVGIAGLMGAGRTELVRALFGVDPIDCGQVTLDGEEITIHSPQNAISAGIVLGPEDRKAQGLCTKLSIRENIALANLDQVCGPLGVVHKQTERKLVDDAVKRLGVKTPTIEQSAQNLSGGNQQKVVVAKWLARKARVVIFDEPTRGIDVAAKVGIYSIMNELKEQGIGVLFVSSEMPEVMGMSDRILVMCNGRMTGELDGQTATADEILSLATRYQAQ